MKECFAITTYCNTENKLRALNRTIDNIKQYELPIFIHAHYPLPSEIQNKVHSYFYSSDNPVLKSRWNLFWYFVDGYKLEIKIYDYYFTTLKGWDESIKICDNYDRIHMINYDTNLTPELFNLSKKYPQSLFLQNSDTSRKYICPTYFCLNKKSYNFFRENITLDKYIGFDYDSQFIPLVEEFIPSFTIGDDFFIIPHTEFDLLTLLEYDVASDTRFDWNKTLTLDKTKIFIGEFNESASILFFDVKEKIHIDLNINGFISEFNIDSINLFHFYMTFKDINTLIIKVDGVNVSEDLIKRFKDLECKIYLR